jgi:hypothetical protein
VWADVDTLEWVSVDAVPLRTRHGHGTGTGKLSEEFSKFQNLEGGFGPLLNHGFRTALSDATEFEIGEP